jgi:hypothetical protein
MTDDVVHFGREAQALVVEFPPLCLRALSRA